MSFFRPRVSFHLNFASPFNVKTHNSSDIFWLKHYALDKRAHQSTNFQIFQCFNESWPNSSYQFRNHKVKVYSNFASLFSVMKYNFSVFLLSQTLILLTKRPVRVKFSNFCVVWWKFTKFLMSCLKLQVDFSLNFGFWNYKSIFL